MQDLQEGLVPPNHCRQTTGKRENFSLLLALPVSKQGKEEKESVIYSELFQTVPAENPNLNALQNKLLSQQALSIDSIILAFINISCILPCLHSFPHLFVKENLLKLEKNVFEGHLF